MAASFPEGIVVRESAVFRGVVTLPAGSVRDIDVAAGANISASKLEARIVRVHSQSGAAVAQTVGVHRAAANGSIASIVAWLEAGACTGNAEVTVDLKKNGTSVLNGVMTLDDSVAQRETVIGEISSASYSADDKLSLVITSNAGSGSVGSGLSIQLILEEDYA